MSKTADMCQKQLISVKQLVSGYPCIERWKNYASTKGLKGKSRTYLRDISHHRRRYYCLRRRRDNAPCRAIGRPQGQTARRSTADASKHRTRSRPDDKPFLWPFSPNLRRPRCVRILRTLRRKLYKHEKLNSLVLSVNYRGIYIICKRAKSMYRDVSIFIPSYVSQYSRLDERVRGVMITAAEYNSRREKTEDAAKVEAKIARKREIENERRKEGKGLEKRYSCRGASGLQCGACFAAVYFFGSRLPFPSPFRPFHELREREIFSRYTTSRLRAFHPHLL